MQKGVAIFVPEVQVDFGFTVLKTLVKQVHIAFQTCFLHLQGQSLHSLALRFFLHFFILNSLINYTLLLLFVIFVVVLLDQLSDIVLYLLLHCLRLLESQLHSWSHFIGGRLG